MDKAELLSQVNKIKWHHRITLGEGIVTPGRGLSLKKLQTLGLPENLHGKAMLDVGAWDGFFSFEAERRGADRVLATDYFCWNGPGPGTKAGFDLAHRALNSKVEACEIDVLELSPERIGKFDIVLFLGVLYHMRHPLLALEKVRSVTADGGLVIIETHVDMLHISRPAMAFYPGRELANDPTNWVGPNPAAVQGLLLAAGFREAKRFPYGAANDQPAITRAKESPEDIKPQKRMVFHAWN